MNKFFRFLLTGILLVSLCGTGLAFDGNTKLLVHFDGDDAQTTYTAETGQDLTFVGNAQLDTALKKFGTASLLLYTGADGDRVTVPDSTDFDFSTGNFSIESQVLFTATGYENRLWGVGNYAAGGICIYHSSTNNLIIYISGVAIFSSAWTPSTGVFYHVAVSRSGTDLRVFINGTQLGSTITNSTDLSTTTGVWIGNWAGVGTESLHGQQDEFRISDVARWTSDFTAPTAAYNGATVGKVIFINE